MKTKNMIMSVLMILIIVSGCFAVAESNMAIGQESAKTAKEMAEIFAHIYLLDPDGFSTDMIDLLYHQLFR